MNHEAYLAKAYEVATHSNCARRQVGALAVYNDIIIAYGHNSTVLREESCDSTTTCIRNGIASGRDLDICWALHAEQNMLLYALSQHVSLEQSTVYCTTEPCSTCMKLLLGAKVSAIYYSEEYNSPFTKTLLAAQVHQDTTFIFQYIPYYN
ncbi:MAG: deoxycytidylate deaminase [Desulfovibrionaceae bacterium]